MGAPPACKLHSCCSVSQPWWQAPSLTGLSWLQGHAERAAWDGAASAYLLKRAACRCQAGLGPAPDTPGTGGAQGACMEPWLLGHAGRRAGARACMLLPPGILQRPPVDRLESLL